MLKCESVFTIFPEQIVWLQESISWLYTMIILINEAPKSFPDIVAQK